MQVGIFIDHITYCIYHTHTCRMNTNKKKLKTKSELKWETIFLKHCVLRNLLFRVPAQCVRKAVVKQQCGMVWAAFESCRVAERGGDVLLFKSFLGLCLGFPSMICQYKYFVKPGAKCCVVVCVFSCKIFGC